MSKQIHDETDRKKQTKFRLAESKRDALDDLADERNQSRSQLLRTLVDDALDDADLRVRDDDGEFRPDRDDLADIYTACLRHANDKLVLNLRIKGAMLAQDTRYAKKDLTVVLRPLEARGFVRIQCGGVFGRDHKPELAVRVKPPEADPDQWKYRKPDSTTGGITA